MNRRTWIALPLVVALGAGGWWGWSRIGPAAIDVQYRTAPIERGSLTATVAASGTLAPTVQVQVGSQVSGQLREVLADFNTEVRQGQVIARLDPESFEYRVRQAQSDVEAARAQVGVQQATLAARRADALRVEVTLEDARRDLQRKAALVEKNFISPAERERAQSQVRALEQELASARAQIDLARAQVRNAEAVVRQREAQLASARVDLDRTVIRAPVDGVVIKRSVQPGQTVAASLQAPELFVIAQNLRDMQVEVSIDEAEVGRVRVGQPASFTVDAYPGRSFSGVVQQLRKAAANVQNVITYVAIVSADNEGLALLPGMTANVRIVTASRDEVLKLPNAALRFRPARAADAPRPAEAQAGTAGPSAPGAAARAFRERLERELELSDAQRAQLDAIFAQARGGVAQSDVPEAERAKLAERRRSELRARVREILDEGQRRHYERMLADADAGASRARVWRPGPDGTALPVDVRLGLTDGRHTELLSSEGAALAAGDAVIIGSAGSARRTAPRLPF